ncbi:uncharacterized protein LOC121664259 [Corvus kubaryi]|uniref:uncharacterized protein LOC121664259 n=1 Tax=Corvus kubaryi TaxID=68294 RepID=UPI001C04F001|nr:uncharacterized protein LOC121664259 [Corvus kubaryi]
MWWWTRKIPPGSRAEHALEPALGHPALPQNPMPPEGTTVAEKLGGVSGQQEGAQPALPLGSAGATAFSGPRFSGLASWTAMVAPSPSAQVPAAPRMLGWTFLAGVAPDSAAHAPAALRMPGCGLPPSAAPDGAVEKQNQAIDLLIQHLPVDRAAEHIMASIGTAQLAKAAVAAARGIPPCGARRAFAARAPAPDAVNQEVTRSAAPNPEPTAAAAAAVPATSTQAQRRHSSRQRSRVQRQRRRMWQPCPGQRQRRVRPQRLQALEMATAAPAPDQSNLAEVASHKEAAVQTTAQPTAACAASFSSGQSVPPHPPLFIHGTSKLPLTYDSSLSSEAEEALAPGHKAAVAGRQKKRLLQSRPWTFPDCTVTVCLTPYNHFWESLKMQALEEGDWDLLETLGMPSRVEDLRVTGKLLHCIHRLCL